MEANTNYMFTRRLLNTESKSNDFIKLYGRFRQLTLKSLHINIPLLQALVRCPNMQSSVRRCSLIGRNWRRCQEWCWMRSVWRLWWTSYRKKMFNPCSGTLPYLTPVKPIRVLAKLIVILHGSSSGRSNEK